MMMREAASFQGGMDEEVDMLRAFGMYGKVRDCVNKGDSNDSGNENNRLMEGTK